MYRSSIWSTVHVLDILVLVPFSCIIISSKNSVHAGDVDRQEAVCECRCTVLDHLQENKFS